MSGMRPRIQRGDMAALRLVFGDEQASLRLVYDPDETEEALAHGFGFALSYLDRTLAPLVRDIVLRAATGFDGQSGPQSGAVPWHLPVT